MTIIILSVERDLRICVYTISLGSTSMLLFVIYCMLLFFFPFLYRLLSLIVSSTLEVSSLFLIHESIFVFWIHGMALKISKWTSRRGKICPDFLERHKITTYNRTLADVVGIRFGVSSKEEHQKPLEWICQVYCFRFSRPMTFSVDN